MTDRMTPAEVEAERVKFHDAMSEAFTVDQGRWFGRSEFDESTYEDPKMRYAWAAWLARASQAAEQVRAVAERAAQNVIDGPEHRRRQVGQQATEAARRAIAERKGAKHAE